MSVAALRPSGAAEPKPAELTKLSVRPIPDLSPPTIDSRTALWHDPSFQNPSPFIQGTLAIDFSVKYDPAQDPEAREYFGPQRALSRDLPEPETWVRHIAQALVEAMSGARPAPQVIRWTTPQVYSPVARPRATPSRRTAVPRRALALRVRLIDPVYAARDASRAAGFPGRRRRADGRVKKNPPSTGISHNKISKTTPDKVRGGRRRATSGRHDRVESPAEINFLAGATGCVPVGRGNDVKMRVRRAAHARAVACVRRPQ